MKTNRKWGEGVLEIKKLEKKTYGGAKAVKITPEQELRRTVLSTMLFEGQFYESGESITKRIGNLIALVEPSIVANIAVEARDKMHLRHVPLLLAREMARLPRYKSHVSYVLYSIIQRPDELGEFLSLYFADDDKQPLSAQVKKGLAKAFTKFDEYSLAKYNSDAKYSLKDVMFLTHPVPKDKKQEMLWKRLIGTYCANCYNRNFDHKEFKDIVSGTYVPKKIKCNKYIQAKLQIPDTWETELSSGKNKKETFTRLMEENKLGALATIRNLRNMEKADVDDKLITSYLNGLDVSKVLPYRFLSAVTHAPNFKK